MSILGIGRSLLSNDLVRAKVLSIARGLAKTASGAVAFWLTSLLVKHGFSTPDADFYALTLGGIISSVVVWAASMALSWADANKVDTQLQVAAATGKVLPVSGVLKTANVDDAIALAKAGNF